jgi:AcrR family transcriptional regulator
MSAATTTKGETTRSAITEAAYDLFITQGYNGTSMRQIAKKTGIALGGIYNHFSGKEDIFEAVFLENHPFLEMLPAIESAPGDTVEEFVRNAANRMVETIRQKSGFLNLWFIEMVEFKNVHAEQIFSGSLQRGINIVARFSQMEGELRLIPPHMLIRTFIGLFFSFYLAESIFGEIAPAEFTENAMDYYVDVFLHGILGTGST